MSTYKNSELVLDTVEAQAIIENFANRQREHYNKPLHIYRLFCQLRVGNHVRFVVFFEQLERAGYGTLIRGKSGRPVSIKLNTHIKQLGLELQKLATNNKDARPSLPVPTPIKKEGKITIIYRSGDKEDVLEGEPEHIRKLLGLHKISGIGA